METHLGPGLGDREYTASYQGPMSPSWCGHRQDLLQLFCKDNQWTVHLECREPQEYQVHTVVPYTRPWRATGKDFRLTVI